MSNLCEKLNNSFYRSTESRFFDIVEELIEASKTNPSMSCDNLEEKVSKFGEKKNLYHYAIDFKCKECITILSKSIDPNASDQNTITPLAYAAKIHDRLMVRFLLKAGANPQKELNDISVIKEMRGFGIPTDEEEMVSVIISNELIDAIKVNNLYKVEKLLPKSIANYQDHLGKNFLHHSIETGNSINFLKVYNTFYPEINLNKPDRFGIKPSDSNKITCDQKQQIIDLSTEDFFGVKDYFPFYSIYLYLGGIRSNYENYEDLYE